MTPLDDLAFFAAGSLVELLPEWQGVRADFHAVYRQRRHVPARLRDFVAYLEQEMVKRVPPLQNGDHATTGAFS